MTDEEKAEEYARKTLSKDCCDLKLEVYKRTINSYLAGVNEVKADCDFALEGKDIEIKELRDNYEQFKASAIPEIKRLQKENTELKSELTKKADTNHSLVEQMAEQNEKLEEAKDIISELVKNSPDTYSGTNIEVQQRKMFAFQNATLKAEQFLKENE